MSAPLIAITTVIYVGVACSEYVAGRRAMSLVFAAYALANVGLILQVWK